MESKYNSDVIISTRWFLLSKPLSFIYYSKSFFIINKLDEFKKYSLTLFKRNWALKKYQKYLLFLSLLKDRIEFGGTNEHLVDKSAFNINSDYSTLFNIHVLIILCRYQFRGRDILCFFLLKQRRKNNAQIRNRPKLHCLLFL